MHTSVGNNSLGKTVTDFALAGSLKSATVVLIDIERAFAGYGEKIRLPKTEVLLRAAAGKLVKLKKLRDWTARNDVLLPPFLTEIILTIGENTVKALLKIFSERITEKEAENSVKESDMDKEIRFDKDNKRSAKTRLMKYATARDATDGITADCNNILAFLQAVALKAP